MNIDPRGIRRTIVEIEETPSATFVTLDCGHRNPMNQQFHYELGSTLHCHPCGKEARAQPTGEATND